MQTEELRKGPLEGITVLDFSRVLAGPYCTMILADLGARVIKIEKFGTGDDTRAFGPFVDGESAYFMCFNRGKESIVLDIKSPRDRELLERLLDEADVVVENFRPGVMDRLGYGAERLAKTHPHIIYASVSGFGHSGPFSDLPGYDMVVQAMGGIMSLTGWPDGPPSRVGTSFGDLGAALFATVGILASLYKRNQNAQGARVDIGMLDCQAALMETALARYDAEGKVPNRTGDSHPSLAPFESFAAKDGRIVIAAGNDTLFVLMADALGAPELALQAPFATNDLRCQNRPQMVKAIRCGKCETMASTRSWWPGSIRSTMDPQRRQSSSTFCTESSSVPGGGVTNAQRPSNSSAKPASGPEYSVPAIGWAGTKCTPSGTSGPTSRITDCLVEPTSVRIAPGARHGAMRAARSAKAPTGAHSMTQSAPSTALHGSISTRSARPNSITRSSVFWVRAFTTISAARSPRCRAMRATLFECAAVYGLLVSTIRANISAS